MRVKGHSGRASADSGRSPWSRLEGSPYEDGSPGVAAESVAGNESENEKIAPTRKRVLDVHVFERLRDGRRARRGARGGGRRRKPRSSRKSGEAARAGRCGDRPRSDSTPRPLRSPPRGRRRIGDDAPAVKSPAAGGRRCASLKVWRGAIIAVCVFMAENDANCRERDGRGDAAAEAKLSSQANRRPSAPAVAGGLLLKPTRLNASLASAGTRTKPAPASHKARRRRAVAVTRRFFDADSDAARASSCRGVLSRDSSGSDAESDDDDAWARKQTASAGPKAEKLGVTDHASSGAAAKSFRKNFYIESFEVRRMTEDEVAEYVRSWRTQLLPRPPRPAPHHAPGRRRASPTGSWS